MSLRTTATKDMDSPAINEAIMLATLLSSMCSSWYWASAGGRLKYTSQLTWGYFSGLICGVKCGSIITAAMIDDVIFIGNRRYCFKNKDPGGGSGEVVFGELKWGVNAPCYISCFEGKQIAHRRAWTKAGG